MNHFKKTLFAVSLLISTNSIFAMGETEQNNIENQEQKTSKAENCEAPWWAISIGHEEKWKLHNGCSDTKKTEQPK